MVKENHKNEVKIIETTPPSKIDLVYGGEDYFIRLLHLISNAKSEIHFQTYIFDNDETGNEIADALKEAVARKVKVFLLLDAYGSTKLKPPFIKSLIKHGVNVRFYSSLFSANTIYLGRRLHHKVIVADSRIALVGGINIANKYRGSETREPWLDYAVQIENLAAAKYLQNLCKSIYLKKKSFRWKSKTAIEIAEGESIRIIENDWLKRKNEISNSYLKAIRTSKNEIIIVGSYYLPGLRFTNVLKRAARRGVKIKLILAGISDVPLIRRATCYLYGALIKQNIELYEWKNSILHGKVAMVDNEWATVGSFNLNNLSSYGSIEMNIEIRSKKFSKTLKSNLNHIISQSEKITKETLKTRNGPLNQLLNGISFFIIRGALIILTYLPYNRLYKTFLK